MPDTASIPDHALDAAQDVASVADQVSVLLPPDASDAGLADSVTLGVCGGAGVTVTVTELAGEAPDEFEHVIEYALVALGETATVPAPALVPDQPPVAAHEAAEVDDQLSTALPPSTIEFASAARATVGSGGFTLTVAETGAEAPAGPVQVSV